MTKVRGTLHKANPLAQMSGDFSLHSLNAQLCLYVALDRFDRVSELCFTTDNVKALDQISTLVEELSQLLLGLDLVEVSNPSTSQLSDSAIELLSCIDDLIFQFRHGGVVKKITQLALEDHLLCPCHSLTSDTLIKTLKNNPNPTLAQLQAELGIGVGCDSCVGACQNFCRDYVAAHRLAPAPFPPQMKLQGMGQAQVALKVQEFLDLHHNGVIVLSLKGFDLRLSEREHSMEEALRAGFEINFSFEAEACRP